MRISQEEWNKRLEEVKLASEDCKTIEEIVGITDYSRYIIKQLFEKFPEEAKKIQDNLAKNNSKTKKKKRRKPNNKRRLTKILEASETCRSLVELSKITGFSDYIIKNTLSKFPDEEAKVRENLAKNKSSKITTCNSSNSKHTSKKDNEFSIVMLDTSVSLGSDIFHILENYIHDGKILGITDVALEELATIQKYGDDEGRCACDFLLFIMDKISAFQLFEVKHSMIDRETADEAIIRATIDLKNDALLLTSDKEMFIKATLKSVKVKYLSQNKEERSRGIFDSNKTSKPVINKKYSVDLVDVVIEKMQAIYIEKHRKNQVTKVFSRKGEEKQGERITLEVGDHIFICTAKEDCITFADYEAYDITQNSFCMRYNKRLYHFETEVDVAVPEYKKFIEQARKTLIK